MERPFSALQQRTKSFNPEAATFNPVFSSPVRESIAAAPAASLSEDRTSPFSMSPMFNYSPFHAAGGIPSLYRRSTPTPAPIRLEDFLSPDVRTLVRKLEEHPAVQEIRASHTPATEETQAQDAVANTVAAATPTLPQFTFPAQRPQPDYAPVDINELGAGLGLPVSKTDTTDDASTSGSHKSRLSQVHPGELYGKLIGWALEKPLTARGLAEYLQSQQTRISFDIPARKTVSPISTVVQGIAEMEPSRPKPKPTCEVDVQAPQHIPAPSPTETITVPKGPPTYQHQHRRSSASSASFRHHTRMPSNRRYSRRTSRAKRMDQGPMPSAADIYPDDANWTPSAPIYEATHFTPYHQPPIEQPQIVIDNVFNWPPPAQVYAPEPAPTTADIDAADNDVLALMNELPEPTLCTLAALGNSHDLRKTTAFELPCDERALTPAQIDGTRYGIRFYGLAYGDQWELPKVGDFGEGEALRVRPRDHEGWGGIEWALKKG